MILSFGILEMINWDVRFLCQWSSEYIRDDLYVFLDDCFLWGIFCILKDVLQICWF